MHALLIGLLSSLLTAGLLAGIGKDEVKRLVQAGIGEQTIVEFIRKNAPADPLSAEDIMELRNAGATDAVITAMLETSRTSDALSRSTYGQPDNSYYSYSNGTVVQGYPYPTYSYSYYPYYPYFYYPYPYYYRPYRYYPSSYYNRYPYTYRYPYSYYRPNYSTAPYRRGYYPYSSGHRYSTPSYSNQPYRTTRQYRGTHQYRAAPQSAPRMSSPAPRTAPAPRSSSPAPSRGGAGSYRR